jgi:2-aminoadipate transaminase
VAAINRAISDVLQSDRGTEALQYATTEGYPPLVEWICRRYEAIHNLPTTPDQILITTGSQQGLDLIGKLFIDKGDGVVIESPGYLGAIQAFSLYEPTFCTVPLLDNGVDIDALQTILRDSATPPVKLFYAVPNFQNPSGISYSAAKREQVGALLQDKDLLFVEDDPYGDLRFKGSALPPVAFYAPGNVIMLGSFSKTVAPGLRIGWVRASAPITEKLVTIKQAADLHSSIFSQMTLSRYLADNDHEAHIATICAAYGSRRDRMIAAIEREFGTEAKVTRPEGGMFLWMTLPEGVSSMALFNAAIEKNVAFVPGFPFYVNGAGGNTLRLNFSNAAATMIDEGIHRIAEAYGEMAIEKG